MQGLIRIASWLSQMDEDHCKGYCDLHDTAHGG